MTSLPRPTEKKLWLVIDLDICVGCQACATSCQEWNTSGYSAPLSDQSPYGADPHGSWLNRVHGYEVGEGSDSRTVHFPRSQEDNFKIGLAVSAISNRITYVQERSDGTVLVLMKIFQVGAEEDYVDAPWTEPEKGGSAVQLFYGGGFGFGEIEAHSGKFETTGQRCSAQLEVKVFAFSGSPEDCESINPPHAEWI